MFGNFGPLELAVIALFGLFLFGPERLPGMAAEAAKMIARLRGMTDGAMGELKSQLGPEFENVDLRSLNPRRMLDDAVREHLLGQKTGADNDPDQPGFEVPAPKNSRSIAAKKTTTARKTAAPKTAAPKTTATKSTATKTTAATKTAAAARPRTATTAKPRTTAAARPRTSAAAKPRTTTAKPRTTVANRLNQPR